MELFVSHSRRDKKILQTLQDATPVVGIKKAILYEDLPPDEALADGQRIRELIREADAVLIIQTSTTEGLDHTKSWIAFECAVAAAFEKPIILVRNRSVADVAPFPLVTDYAEVDFDEAASVPIIQRAIQHHMDRPLASYPLVRTTAGAAGGSILGPLGMLVGAWTGYKTTPKESEAFTRWKCAKCRQELRIWSSITRCPTCAANLAEGGSPGDGRATHH